jgi:hypothetical protein
MTNSIQVVVQCASGRTMSFGVTDVTDNTLTTLVTQGVGLNQTSAIDLGNALPGETIVRAYGTVTAATTASITVSYNFGYIENSDGSIALPIEGGGCLSGDMPSVCRPLRVTVGMLLKAQLNVATATSKSASLVAYCASGKTAVFNVTAVADTKTEMVDVITGGTIGQSLAGQRIIKSYATFSNLYGLNDDQGGNNFYFMENAQGQLKGTFFPVLANGYGQVKMVDSGIPVLQNDSLSVTWGS